MYLGRNEIHCFKGRRYYFNLVFNVTIDIFHIIDLVTQFFIAFYDFDEILITKHSLIAEHYLKTWFFVDFISAIPVQSLLIFFDKKCYNPEFLNHPIYTKNYVYLFILLRLMKIFKVVSNNKFVFIFTNEFSKFNYFNNYGRLSIGIFIFCISLHIVACVFLFIGKNDYPNWIGHFEHTNKNFLQLYLISIYYTITTLTTVGYGDLTCVNFKEKIFGLFLEIVGIFAYSWALTSISNYIKILNDKTEELSNNIKILDEIKLTYPNFSDELYDRIKRYLKYKHFNEKKNKHNIIDELPIGLRNSLIFEMYKPIIKNFIFFKNFTNTDFIIKVILAFKPILSLKNDILIKDGDLVEDIIFVKRGTLSLQLPFVLNVSKLKRTFNFSAPMRRSTLFFNNIARDASVNKGFYNFKPMKRNSNLNKNNKQSKFSLLNISGNEEKEEVQYFRILEIRRNEHFGDILMFLDQRSPLCLRVKSRKAELFFLNKEDAVNISASYPQYWKKINQKSLFNMEQIKRLTNRIVKMITNEHGVNPNKYKKIKKTNSFASSISIIEDGDNDLKSIPSLTRESELNIHSDDSSSSISESSDDSSSEEKSLIPKNNNRNNIIKSYFNETGLKTIVEDYNRECTKKSSVSDNSMINPIQNTFKTYSTQKHESKYIKKPTELKYLRAKTHKRNYTPYNYDEINDEIYPEETFIISQQSNPNFQFEMNEIYKKKSSIDNISICSTEISFSINSEYDNIDQLSDHNYSKDDSFRKKVENFIKEEINLKNNQKNYKSNTGIDFNNTKHINFKSIKEKDEEKRVKFKRVNTMKSMKSVKSAKSQKNINNDDESPQSNSIIIPKSKQFMTGIEYKYDDDKKRSKKDILSVISQKIEKDNLNLNNPDLFYSEVFMKFLDKKKTHDDSKNGMNDEEKDFLQRMGNIGIGNNTIVKLNSEKILDRLKSKN